MKKAKSILFKVKLTGNGIVNFDSVDQKRNFYGTNLQSRFGTKNNNNNVNYAKKRFYKKGTSLKDDGSEITNLDYIICISSDSLRHDIFKMDANNQSPNICHHNAILYSYIASPANIIRGYMFTNDGGNNTIRRKTSVTITGAQQTCDAHSTIEAFSRSGLKNSDINTVDNTFFYKEVVGDIKYEAFGSIDLMQMQFVSCDPVFDRYCFNPDLFELYKSFLQSKMSNFNSELGHYLQDGSSIDLAEYGFKFSDENIVQLTKEFFQRLLRLNIVRSGSYAKIEEIEYKLVYDCLEDKLGDDAGWESIRTKEDVNNLDFETKSYYTKTEDSEKLKRAEEINTQFIQNNLANKKAKAAAKAKEKAAKAKAKKLAEKEKAEAEAEAAKQNS